MDITVSAYRQAYHDWVDKKISKEEFWEKLKEIDSRQPELFKKEDITKVTFVT